MSSGKGYIKIYRDIWDHWIWKSNRPFDEFHAWVDLIMLMNHQKEDVLFDGKLIPVQRGSRITSLRQLAIRWGWGKNHVSSFLELLEKNGMISQVRDSKKTLVSVVNYSIYQNPKKGKRDSDEDTDRDTDEDADEDTDGLQTIHYKDTIESTIEENIPDEDDWEDDPGDDPEEAYRKWKEQNGNL